MPMRRSAGRIRWGLFAGLVVIVLGGVAAVVVRSMGAPVYEVVARLDGPGGPTIDPPPRKVKLGTSTRSAITASPGSSFEIEVAQPGSLLLFSLGADSDGADARFVVEAQAEAGWQPIFDERMKSAKAGWDDRIVNLGEVAPRARRLRFAATFARAEAKVYWGSIAFLRSQGRVRSLLESHPNVILISVDTLNAAHLSSFGNSPGVSPHIDDALGASFSFRKAYAQYPNTLVSHASLFTGLFPKRHGVYSSSPMVRSNTLAAMLAKQGYVTVAVTEDAYVSSGFGFDRGFDWYDDGESEKVEEVAGDAPRTFKEASGWLDTFGATTKFFLFVHTYEVHVPYKLRTRDARRIVDRIAPGYHGRFESAYPGGEIEMDHNSGKTRLAADELKRVRALYAGKIHELDEVVGGFLRHLSVQPFAGRTLVVFTSDHGEEFGEHGKLSHGETLFTGALHVPLGFYWPGTLKSGTSETPVELIDVLPTVLDLVGVEKPPDIDGRTLAPIVLGKGAAEPSRPAFAEMRYVPFAEQRVPKGDCLQDGLTASCEINLFSVKTDRFDLIKSTQTGFEAFFDLDHDPAELHDVRDAFPRELESHRALLRDYADDAIRRNAGEAQPTPGVDDETLKRLKALGYVK